MQKLLTLILLLVSLTLPAAARAGQPYLVSGSTAGNIWRIEDTNGDGDALDTGERTLWGNGFGDVVGLESFAGAVYAVERGLSPGNNEIVRLTDANGDGDALDLGERIVWAAGLNDPRDIARDVAGNFYVTDFGTDEVWRLVDANGDGDALDVGERTLFADAIGGTEMLLPWAGGMLVSTFTTGEVNLLADVNGDGDALDTAEKIAILSGVDETLGLLVDGSGGFYVTSLRGDTVYHATDNNGDGDFFDVAEVLSYADSVFGGIDRPAGMVSYEGGGFLLAESTVDGQIVWVKDRNGDGDALDLGEVILFADGIDRPVDIIALQVGLPGDYNDNGVVDAADYTVWRDNLGSMATLPNDPLGGMIGQAHYDQWKANFGMTAGPGAGSGSGATGSASALATVPEPSTLLLAIAAATLLLTLRGKNQKR